MNKNDTFINFSQQLQKSIDLYIYVQLCMHSFS